MELVHDKNKRSGLIGTVIFHGILLLLFFFIGLKYMVPPPEEEGITINFGSSEDGSGDVQPTQPTTTDQSDNNDQPSQNAPEIPVESSPEVLTQDSEEAPKIKSQQSEEKPVEEVEEEKPQPSKQLTDALSKLKNNSGAKQANEGETGKPGDQGRLDGDINSRNRNGGGSGNGVLYNLSGRQMTRPPKIKDDSQEEGKVVVEIVVDKQGNVIRATPGARGSTTTSPLLYRKAKEAALLTKFNMDGSAAIEQKGNMTFIFILN